MQKRGPSPNDNSVALGRFIFSSGEKFSGSKTLGLE